MHRSITSSAPMVSFPNFNASTLSTSTPEFHRSQSYSTVPHVGVRPDSQTLSGRGVPPRGERSGTEVGCDGHVRNFPLTRALCPQPSVSTSFSYVPPPVPLHWPLSPGGSPISVYY